MKDDIPSFSRNLNIESFLNWIYEVDKFFDIAYIPMEKQVKFWQTSSRAEQPHGGINTNLTKGLMKATRDDMEAQEATLTR